MNSSDYNVVEEIVQSSAREAALRTSPGSKGESETNAESTFSLGTVDASGTLITYGLFDITPWDDFTFSE